MPNSLTISEFLHPLSNQAAVRRISARTSYSISETEKLLYVYIEEAVYSYELIRPYLEKNIPILEVGGGLMLLSSYLRSVGYNITSIDPVGTGFDFFEARAAIIEELGTAPSRLFNIKAEELAPEGHGYFDLIYSVNVLEHIGDINTAIKKMSSVMSNSGMMFHTCPNYFIPYEPHFSIPLLPIYPSLTRYIFKNKIKHNIKLWGSLNFITYKTINKLSEENGLVVSYKKGVLGEAIGRMYSSKEFSERHGKFARIVIKIITLFRFDKILNSIPGKYLTPITFTLRKKPS